MERNNGMENGMDFNLLLTQKLSSNWIVPTDNMQPKPDNANWCHQWLKGKINKRLAIFACFAFNFYFQLATAQSCMLWEV